MNRILSFATIAILTATCAGHILGADPGPTPFISPTGTIAQRDSLPPQSGNPAQTAALPTGSSRPSTKATTSRSDSLKADSLRIGALRDSILGLRANEVRPYLESTTGSVTDPSRLSCARIFDADALTATDVLRNSVFFENIPYSLASSSNRSLFLGRPAPRSWQNGIGSLSLDGRGNLETHTPTELFSLDADPAMGPTLKRFPDNPTGPHMVINWENGVFDENAFQVLFSRPITDEFSAAIFTSHRYFAAKNFSHHSGNIDGIYQSLTNDTSLIVLNGKAPRTNEMLSGMRGIWRGKSGTEADIEYRYEDLQDEIAKQARDLDGNYTLLTWNTISQFVHAANAHISNLKTGAFTHRLGAALRADQRTVGPAFLAPTTLNTENMGKSFQIDGSTRSTLALALLDTISALWQGSFEQRTLYNNQLWPLNTNRAEIVWQHRINGSHSPTTLSGGVGQLIHQAKYALGNVWILHAESRTDLPSGYLSLYARRDAEAYRPPLDTAVDLRGSILDPYIDCGATSWLSSQHAGLLLNYSFSTGIDSATLANAWLNGVPPYQEPRSTFTLCPVLGTGSQVSYDSIGKHGGVSFFSRWTFADRRPYIKSLSGISWEGVTAQGNERIRLELLLDYWSMREEIGYAGKENWNWEIWDLSFKTSIRIKSFRLFYKMDNILNRKNAYIPGNTGPGLTFRWGFNWFLDR